MFIQKWAVLIALSFGTCAAQTATNKPPEPELIGVFFYLDSATQTLKPLPREEYKTHSGGFTTITQEVKLDGTASSFHISSNDKVAFVFRASEESAEKAKLYRCSINGGRREVVLGKLHRADFKPNPGLPVDITKFGESSYKIVPQAPLDPGEYALLTGVTQTPVMFTLGVSPSGR